MGLVSGVFLVSGLVENYSKSGCVNGAEKCFEECLVLDSVVWTAMINGFVWNGLFDKGREIFMGMRGLGLELNEFSLTSVLGALFEVKEGEQIHGFSLKMGFLCGCSTNSTNFMFDEIQNLTSVLLLLSTLLSLSLSLSHASYLQERLDVLN
ncbi:hypothetical protein TEA_025607 [Camellia sinensis var. sinensis]|uniref:Pentatricopeptide repeat-containing protein n=1 Tax=Camellia sinensis var. sinensis TaxID=542762 RepID=A0A4S4EL73_CAMSN|nr:hypothetical protein TEA_025607 [Camellia sinensis var. sinensis]